MAQWVTLKIQEILTAKILLLCDDSYSITFNILCTPCFAHSADVLGSSQIGDLDRFRKGCLHFFYQLLFAVIIVQFLSESTDDTSRTACAGEIRWLLNLSSGQYLVNKAGESCKKDGGHMYNRQIECSFLIKLGGGWADQYAELLLLPGAGRRVMSYSALFLHIPQET